MSQRWRPFQDVWVVPPRGSQRQGDAAANTNVYGTTLRVYDPRIDAWQIQWTDPVTQTYLAHDRPQEGSDIVQLGRSPDGNMIRWSFRRSCSSPSAGAVRCRSTTE